jgi:2'-5' RNA ligase
MKLFTITEKKSASDGTYVALKVSPESKKLLKEVIRKLGVPSPLDTKDAHSTLIYSRKPLPDFKANGKLKSPIVAKCKKLTIFPTDDGKALVIELDNKEMQDRFEEIMSKHEATSDYDEYKPHVTLSYDCGDFDISRINISDMIDSIEFSEEYSNKLILGWASKK